MISVYPLGHYAHRQPLAYAQIRAQCRKEITLANDPARADIVVVAHSKDIDTHSQQLRALSRDQRLVLLSEEPFWDTIWGQNPLTRDLTHIAPDGPLHLVQLNHHTSSLYNFEAIPYFLLTNSHFATRYALWFSENALLNPADWQRHFESVRGHGAFIMTHRRSDRYEVSFPQADTRSLCNLRTSIAEACQSLGFVNFGKGWDSSAPRQTLTDWHLEKYLTLKGRFQFVGAIENTHQPDYVTEKIFDAWAARAIPLAIAASGHRVHELALPHSWVNLDNCPLSEIPKRLEAIDIGPSFYQAYTAQQHNLAVKFSDPDVWHSELERLRIALVAEFSTILDIPPPQD